DTHLRFDFTHMKKMEEREIARAEEIVNENIKKAIPVKKEIKELESAKSEGAMALFGEKYDKLVRVVAIGDVSKELCGGTHVDNTKEVDIFKITSESSIASGVRRIEALTGEAAHQWIKKQEEAQDARFKAQSEKEEEKRFMAERLMAEFERVDSFLARSRHIGDLKLVNEVIDTIDMDGMRRLNDRIRSKEKNAIIILATKTGEKISFVVSVPDEAVKNGILRAADVAKDLAKLIDGSGGGRPDFAQGGGKDPSKLGFALNAVAKMIKDKVDKR
ncbi:MAG: DHHA1 domain-containing protein, partial [Candidatus Omnitrophota bacterium]|nr:DHHA1 domain-containing protein [Candidatus Omnitrophota bacterium]